MHIHILSYKTSAKYSVCTHTATLPAQTEPPTSYSDSHKLLLFLHLPSFTHTPTDCSSDKRRGVSNVVEAFSFDEVGHVRREVLVVSFHIVLQNQTTQRASGLVLGGSRETA